MGEHLAGSEDRVTHWDTIYETVEANAVSWYQSEPLLSLELIQLLGIDSLLSTGFTDLTVLDISRAALLASRQRVGHDAPVTWLAENLLTWEPTRTYELWHDRAVFHFLSGSEVEDYRNIIRRALSPGGAVIVATFAADGPEYCSGLPVGRYSPRDLAAVLGADFDIVEERREEHHTPGGAIQPFTWVAARSK
jgi:hypothetical protein